jgi:hypothetical protein
VIGDFVSCTVAFSFGSNYPRQSRRRFQSVEPAQNSPASLLAAGKHFAHWMITAKRFAVTDLRTPFISVSVIDLFQHYFPEAKRDKLGHR